MFIFNLKGPFPGKLIGIAQAFMNFYKKKEMLTLVTFASLGGLSKIQKCLNHFQLREKNRDPQPTIRPSSGNPVEGEGGMYNLRVTGSQGHHKETHRKVTWAHWSSQSLD